jgi:hypothetical protein
MFKVLSRFKMVLVLSLIAYAFHAKAHVTSAYDARKQLNEINRQSYQKGFLLKQLLGDIELLDLQSSIFSQLLPFSLLPEIGEIIYQEANNRSYLFYPPQSGWMSPSGDVYLDAVHGDVYTVEQAKLVCGERGAELVSEQDVQMFQSRTNSKPGFLALNENTDYVMQLGESMGELYKFGSSIGVGIGVPRTIGAQFEHKLGVQCVIRNGKLPSKNQYDIVVHRVSSGQGAIESSSKIYSKNRSTLHPALNRIIFYWDNATNDQDPLSYYYVDRSTIETEPTYVQRGASSVESMLEAVGY